MTEKFTEIFEKYLPEIPVETKIKLPSLKKTSSPKLPKLKMNPVQDDNSIKLPKLKPVSQ